MNAYDEEWMKKVTATMLALEMTIKNSYLADEYVKNFNDVYSRIHSKIGDTYLKQIPPLNPDSPTPDEQ